jgi:hypothetical protein
MPKVDVPVDYDTYAKSDRSTQVGVFNAITAANRAQIVRTQITRWVAANRATLNAEQIEAVNAALAIVTEEMYRDRMPEERKREIMDPVVARLESVLTRDQIFRCLVAGAPHIPE